MNPFFRRIRQQFINQKSIGRYILYAFGEIVLIIIGILIAVQLNEWRKEKDNKNKETVFIQLIKEKLNKELIVRKAFYEMRLNESGYWPDLINAFYKTDAEIDQLANNELSQGTRNKFMVGQWAMNLYNAYSSDDLEKQLNILPDNVVSSLINLGDLKIINSPKLRQAIVEYNEKNEEFSNNTKQILLEKRMEWRRVKNYINPAIFIFQYRPKYFSDTKVSFSNNYLKQFPWPTDIEKFRFKYGIKEVINNKDLFNTFLNLSELSNYFQNISYAQLSAIKKLLKEIEEYENNIE